ncbi:GNAT family N-acetyltransferase [Streptomyces sp. NPDC057375]|uniref:GNAT family N-acetyltransferase n=1 Tax=Streptomyces sp. NPDC057375 TaxID=3346109 RepID=UPI00363C7F48
MNPIVIRSGGAADMDSVLTMLDKAVAWLTAHGRTGQWGGNPFSSDPARREQISSFLERHMVRIAEMEGRPVGVCTLAAETPHYVNPAPEAELYIHLLVTDREFRGVGIGGLLCADAVAQAQYRGIHLVRVDCYGGDDRALVRQYERLGFTATRRFTVERENMPPWPGQILEKRVPETGVEDVHARDCTLAD